MRDLKTTVRVVLATSLMLGVPAYGQKVPTGPLQPEASAQQEHAIKVHVNEVIVPVTVLDPKGDMIFDLTKEHFHIFENGVEQSIEQFDLGGDSLAVALVIETSSHIQMMAPTIRRIGSVFTETVMALEGKAAA